MRVFEWKNLRTGKIVEHTHPTEPPSPKGKWQRIYSFGVGSISGGSTSKRPKHMTSLKKDDQ